MKILIGTLFLYIWCCLGSLHTYRKLLYTVEYITNGKTKNEVKLGAPNLLEILIPQTMLATELDMKSLKICAWISHISLISNLILYFVTPLVAAIYSPFVLYSILISYALVALVVISNAIIAFTIFVLNEELLPSIIAILCPSLGYVVASKHLACYLLKNREYIEGDY